MNKPFTVIPPAIVKYWEQKYGQYLTAYSTEEIIIFCENGRLDCFHPSGDRLARHHIPTGQTVYLWNNNPNELLTEKEYMIRLGIHKGD